MGASPPLSNRNELDSNHNESSSQSSQHICTFQTKHQPCVWKLIIFCLLLCCFFFPLSFKWYTLDSSSCRIFKCLSWQIHLSLFLHVFFIIRFHQGFFPLCFGFSLPVSTSAVPCARKAKSIGFLMGLKRVEVMEADRYISCFKSVLPRPLFPEL